MSHKIWVYIDHFKGEALPVSWETIGAGRFLGEKLGGSVTALAFGSQIEGLANQAFEYGADEVILAEDASLVDYRPEPFTSLLASLAQKDQPEVILFPTTSRGRELAAMCAIDLDTGVLADVIALEVEGAAIKATRPVYAGKILAKVECQTKPQIITVRTRSFKKPAAESGRTGKLERVQPVRAENEILTKVIDYVPAEGGVSLTDANIIVSGGRGVSNNPKLTPPEGLDDKAAEIWRAHQGFKLVDDLAEVLGAAVGASRAAVDAGYIPYVHQVGQTGKVVSPDLYIACGISGAIQHLAGMRTSKIIVAINKDPDAPIFKLARFGVVADLYDILPPLTETFRKKLAG